MKRVVIDAIIEAAEAEGGIQNIHMCGGRTSWGDCVASGLLWYNDKKNSTKTIKIKEEEQCKKSH